MREVVYDSETTGLSVGQDRIVEIGCVELVDRRKSGRTFQAYVNPGRPVGPSEQVHGLTDAFLADKPRLDAVLPEFLAFLGPDPIVGHNAAAFDMAVLRNELARLNRPMIPNPVVDTLPLARRVKKSGGHKLDDLRVHFGLSMAGREKHGALVDAEILADVYACLHGAGNQIGFDLGPTPTQAALAVAKPVGPRSPFVSRLTDEDRVRHAALVADLKDPIWREYGLGAGVQA